MSQLFELILSSDKVIYFSLKKSCFQYLLRMDIQSEQFLKLSRSVRSFPLEQFEFVTRLSKFIFCFSQ